MSARRCSFLDLVDWSANRYEMGSMLTGVIYIHRISDKRFGGVAGRNFNMFRKICGELTFGNVAIVTNMWEDGSRYLNEARDWELRTKLFKQALEGGAQVVRHQNTAESAHNIIQKILRKHPAALQIQRELVDERKDIVDTAAGKTIKLELEEQIRRREAELREVREEMERALKEKDEGTRQELEGVTRGLQERMEEIVRDKKWMSANYAAEKGRVEARIKEMERGAQKRERDEANHAHYLQDDTIVADRAKSKQQTKRPQELTSTTTATPSDEPAHQNTPSRTGETEFSPLYQRSLPQTPPRTPSPRHTSHVALYVQVPFRLATHDD